MLVHAIRRPTAKEWLFDLNNAMYTFAPDAEGRMVCDVTDPHHIELIRSRTGHFALLGTAPAPAPEPPAESRKVTIPDSSSRIADARLRASLQARKRQRGK